MGDPKLNNPRPHASTVRTNPRVEVTKGGARVVKKGKSKSEKALDAAGIQHVPPGITEKTKGFTGHGHAR